MSLSAADLASFQSFITKLANQFGAPPQTGPGTVTFAPPDYGVNLFTNQGPTSATVQSKPFLVRGEHNSVVIIAIPAPDNISPSSTPTCTIQVQDSPNALNPTYTSVIDSNGTLSAITTTTKRIVSGVQAYVKCTINVTHGLWTVIASTIPATSTSTITTAANVNLAQVGGTTFGLGQQTSGASIPVVLASDQSVIPVQGTVAAGATMTANPLSTGLQDASGFAQYLQGDANKNLYTTLGTRLDPYNDEVNGLLSYGYPSQQRSNTPASTTVSIQLAPSVSPSLTPLANSLGTAGLPSLAPVHWLRLTISNNATLQNITALSIAFSDTVDSATDTITLTYPLTGTLVASGSKARFWFPVPEHYSMYPNATLTVTFGSAASAGYVQVQTVWGFTPITSWPVEWQWGNVVNLTNNTTTQIQAAPPAGTRLVIDEVIVTNASTTTGTLVTFQSGSGGSTIADLSHYAQFNGMGWKAGPYNWGEGIRMATATALFAICGTTGSNVYASARGHYEPI